jgi:hypothetical protein
MICQSCKTRGTEAQYAWQPLGPDEKATSFMALGSHYRGFPVIKICGTCKHRIEQGQPVYFAVKSQQWLCEEGRVSRV